MPSEAFPFIEARYLPMPGTCAKCGSSKRGCVDLLIDHDYYGAVMICELCIKELTNVDQLGLIHRDEVAKLMAQNDLLSEQNTTLSNARTELRDGINHVLDHYDTVVDSVDNPVLPGLLNLDKSNKDVLQDS